MSETSPAAAGRAATAPTCAAASLEASEPLGGTATSAAEWLLVERRGAYGRDAVADSGLTARLAAMLEAFPGRVLLVRRPDRRAAETVVLRATTQETGGVLVRTVVAGSDDDETAAALEASGLLAPTLAAPLGATQRAETGVSAALEPVSGQVLLVCTHGRRDACCTRLGLPVFDALAAHVQPARLWQSSHHGGHRFAANVLALPSGVQLGRVAPGEAAHVAQLLAAGRIPLDRYRGRTLYAAHVQAAEVAVRSRLGLDGIGDVSLAADDGERVVLAHPGGEAVVLVEAHAGPSIPVSCGQEPEETVVYRVRW